MLACGVDEVDRQIQDEVNMMLMAVAPPALSLDAEEAKRVDQGCEMLSSAEGAGNSLCGYFSQIPRHVAEGARLYAHIAVRHEKWAAVACQGL